MATLKLGNVVVDMRGKINGNVYSKNRGGAYSRVRVIPSNPRSSFQNAVRTVFTANAQAWRALSQADQQSWLSAVASFMRKNRVADAITLTGISLYQSLNKNLADVGIAPIDTAPQPADTTAITVTSFVVSQTLGTVKLTLGGDLDANTAIKVFASAPVSPGINSIGTKMRQFTFEAPSTTSPMTVTTEYSARFGGTWTIGNKVFYSIVPVNATTGQLGAAITGVGLVV